MSRTSGRSTSILVARAVIGILLAIMMFTTVGPSVGSTATAKTPVVIGPRSTGLVIPSWEPHGYESPEVATTLDQVRSLGLRRVTFIVTWYQSSLTDNSFGPTDATPTDLALRSAITQANARGLSVSLKPHIDLPDDTWRGDIVPSDRGQWFATYQEFISRYADLAESSAVTTLIVGTELAGVSTDTRWRTMIRTARAHFSGRLTYAANWDEADQIRFWGLLDEIGIDAYYPLTSRTDGSASVAQLKQGWKAPTQSLQRLATKWGKPIRFTEVGYTRHLGTTASPWDFSTGTPEASAEQATAYQALFEAMRTQRWFAGPDFWAADPPAEEHDELGYSPLGHPAEGRLAAGAASLLRLR